MQKWPGRGGSCFVSSHSPVASGGRVNSSSNENCRGSVSCASSRITRKDFSRISRPTLGCRINFSAFQFLLIRRDRLGRLSFSDVPVNGAEICVRTFSAGRIDFAQIGAASKLHQATPVQVSKKFAPIFIGQRTSDGGLLLDKFVP